MNQAYFIGVDIGTTSTKAIACSETGRVVGMGNEGYPLLVPQPGWAEQDPTAILQAVISALRGAITAANLAPGQIAAISFSGAMHSLIAVDQAGTPLTQAIIWADNRSMSQVEQLKREGEGHRLYLQTGTPIHPMSPLAKLMWLRDNQPECFARAAKFISIKEYVLYQLLGEFVVDHSTASTTGLFNLIQRQWDEAALATAGIRSHQLSELVPTTQVFQGIQPNYAAAIGIDPQTPIVVGATDGVLANLGVGAISSQQVAVTIGTSSAIRAVVPQPITDPQGRTFCYAFTPDRWVIGGAASSGGIVLRWLRDRFFQPETEQAQRQGANVYDWMVETAMQVPVGAEGLLCLPFLSGERAPHWNANARGIFFGLGLHHHRAHLIRAVLEGVLFAVYSIDRALQDLTGGATEIRASGGFVHSRAWCQMLADLFGVPVLIPEVFEGSAFGAAMLGMLAIGAIPHLAAMERLIQIRDCQTPDPSLFAAYQELFVLYDRIYHQVVPEFDQLADYQRKRTDLK